MGEIMGLLPSLAVPGSAIGALVIGVVALLRIRGTDREALSTGQRSYIERLELARTAADERAQAFLQQLDAEREKRMTAEQAKFILEGEKEALDRRVRRLEELLQQCPPPTSEGRIGQ